MNAQTNDLLENCLAELQAGKSLQEVLDRHPQARDELEPLLNLALRTSAERVQDPSVKAINRSRTRMLAKAAQVRGSTQRSGFFGWFPRYAVGVAAALLILVSSYGLLSASAGSLPGDFLYPVKRSAENLRLGLTRDDSEREILEESFEERRSEEVGFLLQQGRVALVSFEGRVAQIGATTWIVDDVRVLINEDTHIIGDIQVDDEIEVEGETRPEGYLLAFELHKRLMTLVGRVDQIGADHWEIDGHIVALIRESDIKDEISIGDFVIALVAVADDYSLSLIEVRLEDGEQDEQALRLTPDPGGEQVEFTGIVESMGSNTWIVDGRLIRIEANTNIDEDIEIGDTVRVRAELRDDTLWAFDIDERDDESDSDTEESDGSDDPDDDGDLSDNDPGDSDDETDDLDSDDDGSDDDEQDEEEEDEEEEFDD